MSEAASTPYTGMRYDEMPDLWDGFARLVRPALGITSFGCNVMDLPPDYATKPHDERDTGQEELYVALAGFGAVVIGDAEDRLELDPDHAVRVGPATSRTLVSGPDGMRVLIVGGTPGEAYVPLEWSSGDAAEG